MRNTRRTGLALLLCLLVTMVLTACGASATNTPVPAPTTAAPAPTTAAPVATTAAPVATTAAVSATTAPAATTAAASVATTATTSTSGQGYQLGLSGFTRIEIPPQINKLLIQALPQIANINPQVSLYVSDATDTAKAATDVDAELKKAGYAYALPGSTAPIAQGTQSLGLYTKSGSPDILFTSAPIDPNQFSPASLQQVGVSAADIQKIQTAVQGKKLGVTFISANGLLNAIIGGATGTSTTPTTGAVASATTAPVSATTVASSAPTAASGSATAVDTFTQLEIPKQLSDPIIASLPIKGVQNPQIAFFVSPEADLAKGADLIDAEFKKQGYKFGYPGVTKPVATSGFYVSAYTKDATSPEAFILVATPQSLNFDKVTAQALVALGATPADAQKFEEGIKSAKSVAMFIYAPGLIKALGGS